MQTELSTIEIKPTSTHKYSLIWLHGLGADGHDFEGIVPQLHLNAEANTHFIFPNAPIQAITINGGMKMPAWYDIYGSNLTQKQDATGITRSAQAICELIEQEVKRGIPYENIALAGFSQGCAMALHTGLRSSKNWLVSLHCLVICLFPVPSMPGALWHHREYWSGLGHGAAI